MGLRDSLIKGMPDAPDTFDTEPLDDMDEFPLINYEFAIEIYTSEKSTTRVALFQKISDMTVSRNIDTLTEGGFNEYTMEFPREHSYNHITFEGGLTSSKFFYKWMMAGKEKGYAQSFNFVLVQRYPNKDRAKDKVKSWYFESAFPVKWKISDLSINDSKTIVVEKLELSFNFFELEEA